MKSSDLFSKTVPLVVECHGFGERRKASLANITVDGTTDQQKVKSNLALSKRLIDADEIRAIRQRDRQFRAYLALMATPFRPGFWLVPTGAVEATYAEAQAWLAHRATLVDVAVAAYPGHVAAMKDALDVYYNPLDYPSASRFKATWWASFDFVDFGVPNVLKTIKADIWQRERAKCEAKGKEFRATIEQHLASSLEAITDHLAKLLAPKGDGKYPVLRDKALDPLFQFLNTIPVRDVTDFAALRAVTARLQTIADSERLTVDRLRDDDALRARMAATMARAQADVSKLVDDDRVRGIILDDVA